MSPQSVQTTLISLVTAVWIIGVAAGAGALLRHQSTPGPDATAPAAWPAVDGLAPRGDAPTLLLFAHPRCPCTRATIEELARLMGTVHGRVETRFIFSIPDGADTAWTNNASWLRAGAIPGVVTIADAGGALHRAFGVQTSGHALLYDGDGSLLFSGGVTGARGHEGGNPGRSAIASLLAGEPPPVHATPVYGCPLSSARLGDTR